MEVSEKDVWLKERATGIGGSDSSVILGINPWKSRLELWTEKTTGVTKEKDSVVLRLGKKLEPFIIEEYIETTKRDVEAGTLALENIRSKEYPWMMCNLDGRISDKERGKGVLECKTKGAYVKWEEDIPNYYYAQIQHYLAVTGYTWASFAVLNFSTAKLEWRDVERDEELINRLVEEERKFWELVTTKVPPKVDGSEACEEFLRDTKETEGKEINLVSNIEATNWALHLSIIKDEIKQLNEHETECKSNLMRIMGDAEVAIGNGYRINWKRPKKRTVFDIDTFKLEHPKLYSSYTTEEEQIRRFLIRFDKKE